MRYSVLTSFIAVTGVMGALGAADTAQAGVISNWVGRGTGVWNSPANWSAGVPGFAGVNHAVVTAGRGSVVVTQNTSPNLATLTIGPSATVAQGNDFDITLTGLANDGVFELGSTGNNTDINLNAPTVTFSGNGVLSLSNASQNRVLSVGAVRTLVHGADHTIGGAGQVGFDNTLIVNEGLIEATLPVTLHLDGWNGANNVNNGVMRARDGATLTLFNTPIDNTNGEIRAEDGSVVLFRNGTIAGGLLEATGSGVLRVASTEAPELQNLHKTGLFQQTDDSDCRTVGTIVNDGVWSLVSSGNNTDLQFNSPTVTFEGSGSVDMSNASQNRLISVGAVRTFVNGASHSIRGAGQVGTDNTLIINEGLIEATLPAGLHLDGWNGAFNLNNALMRARDGSTLTLFNTPIDNTNGVIRAEDGSAVQFRHGTIVGGLLETTGSGALRVASTEAPELQNLHKTGLFQQTDDSDCRTVGTIVNDGVWSLGSSGNNTDLQFNSATVTFEGSGSVDMSNASQNRLLSVGAVRTFVNGSSHTVRGAGQVGFDNTLIINEGVIEATLPAGIHLDGWGGAATVNNNLLRARNGSTLTLFNTVIDNTNGMIRAETDSSVLLRHGTIVGGLLETTGDGTFVVATTEAPTLENLISTGLIRQDNDGDIVLRETVTNDGTWTLGSTGSNTDLQLNSPTVTLAGTGETVLSGVAQNRITSIGAVRTFVNGPFHTIRGAGQIGTDNTLVINKGTMIADQAVEVFFDGWGGAPSRNEGTMHISGAGGMTLSHGAFTNTGTVKIDSTTALRRHGPYTQTDGETRVDGSFNLLSSGAANVSGGLLSGDGTVNGPLNVSGGSASPSNADGSAIGSLELNGNYVQSVDGGYVVDLGLDGNDLMSVTGNVTLGGALQVRLDGPFTPVSGQEFVILTATGTINGIWQCFEFPAGAVGFFHIVYSAHEVKLVVDVVPPQEADLNNDGVVDAGDLAILLGAWGDEPCDNAICCPADLDGDGKVTASDLAILLGSWS